MSDVRARFEFRLFLLAAVVFAPTLFNGFDAVQDAVWLQNNAYLNQGFAALPRVFAETFNGRWQPLHQVVLLLVHAVFGFSPLAFHVLQVLLLALAAGCLPRALALFGVSERVSLAVAVVWVCNPLSVSAVSSIANLDVALSVALLLGAAAALQANRWGVSVVFLLAAMLSKMTVAPLGLILAVHQLRDGGRGRAALFGALSIVGTVLALFLERPALLTGVEASALTALAKPAWYLFRAVWPVALRVIYDPLNVQLASLQGSFTVLFWVGCVGSVLWAALKKPQALPVVSLLWLGFFLALLVSLLRGAEVRESQALLSTLVVSVVVVSAMAALAPSRMWVLVGVWALGLTVLSAQRQREWVDSVTLWQSNTALTPSNVQVVANLATAYGTAGRFSEAYDTLERVRVLQPNRAGLPCAMAVARAARDKAEASWVAQTLPQLCQASPEARWAEARRLLKARDARARVLIEELDMGPQKANAAAAAAGLSLQQRDFASALVLAELAERWGVGREGVVLTRAIALLELGQYEKSMTETETAVRDEKLHLQLMGVRAGALSKLGRADEAEELFRQSVQRLKELGEKVPE